MNNLVGFNEHKRPSILLTELKLDTEDSQPHWRDLKWKSGHSDKFELHSEFSIGYELIQISGDPLKMQCWKLKKKRIKAHMVTIDQPRRFIENLVVWIT